ncbi:MAG: DUF4147 domain-containing protein [Kiritimatiellae bacterium]|nr:DUF4147 domain-containing protein [Kiritimatiellia bacterium]
MQLPTDTQLRADATAIWQAGVAAVSPAVLVGNAVRREAAELVVGGHALVLAPIGRIAVVGAGKAGTRMTAALEQALGADLLAAKRVGGIVNVIDEDAEPGRRVELCPARPAGDPFPTARGAAGSARMLETVAALGPPDLAICLLSGGGSALMPCPVDGVPLEAKRDITARLSACGASIGQLNAVRKHLSRIKGGQLARASRAGRLISLIISDVVGNPLDVIASGPTTPDTSTFADALAVLHRFGLRDRAPASVVRYLEDGAAGRAPETPKALPASVHNTIIGDNRTALAAAWNRASALGYSIADLGAELEGESREVGVRLVELAVKILEHGEPCAPPACILSGGETVVSNVAPGGKGGRNQELVLAAAGRLPTLARDPARAGWLKRVLVLSAGTDGEDGPTDAAGAFVDDRVLAAAEQKGLAVDAFRERSRSYDFFEQTGGLIQTGPTGTNVMDLRVVLVG